MNTMMLCEELSPVEARIISESSHDGKNMWLNGICMQGEIRNRNNRRYPLTEISTAVANAKKQIAENNGIFGELDHPPTLTINSDRISHVITEMWMDGNNAYGKAKLLNTPTGLIAQELLRSGVKIGVSSRGAGAVNESGDVNGFQFITYDIVITPSAPGATPGLVYEALDTKIGAKVMTLAEQMQQDADAQKFFLREMRQFLDVLKAK